MSKTKQYIDQLKQKGADPLNENHEDFVDDAYWYDKYCHYSNLPSPTAYVDSADDESD